MSETTIQITVSGDNAAETLDRITQALPEGAAVTGTPVEQSTLDAQLSQVIDASASLPLTVSNWFSGFATDSGTSVLTALLMCFGILLVAWGGERLIGSMLLSRLGAVSAEPSNGTDGIQRTRRALRYGFVMLLRLCAFYVLARSGVTALFSHQSEAAELGRTLLGTVMLVRVWFAIIEVLTAPASPDRRATGLDDGEAAFVRRCVIWMLSVTAVVSFGRDFITTVVDAGQAGVLFAILCRVLGGLAIAVFFLALREPVGKLIRLGFAADRDAPGVFVRFFSRFWPAFYILLQLIQIAVETRVFLEGGIDDQAVALKRSFGAIILAPFVVAGIREWGAHLQRGAGGEVAIGRLEGFFSLAEGFVIVGTGIFILYAWDIDPFAKDLTGAKRILPGIVSAAIVMVVGISIWRTASAFLDPVKTGGDTAENELPDGEGGKGGSRIETVLPVLRAVLAALIGTVTVLLALSSLGVEIAPLLAGAGILGLAIGFGAQKVVEDVISGVLYLIEDAFRKGEYIETSQGKGIVEAIMLRSVRLRHHLGPVFTIPFSAMGTIQNHSRDWVTVKLSFEVSPDQDLEKVRKLVKKVGAELLEDPELEGQFLAPLKSQGAVAMVGSNYKIGVKFTSEPGKQFLIRRKALNAIQRAFKENGIEMAAPRVIVDSPDQAAAAAAKKLVETSAGAEAGMSNG